MNVRLKEFFFKYNAVSKINELENLDKWNTNQILKMFGKFNKRSTFPWNSVHIPTVLRMIFYWIKATKNECRSVVFSVLTFSASSLSQLHKLSLSSFAKCISSKLFGHISNLFRWLWTHKRLVTGYNKYLRIEAARLTKLFTGLVYIAVHRSRLFVINCFEYKFFSLSGSNENFILCLSGCTSHSLYFISRLRITFCAKFS